MEDGIFEKKSSAKSQELTYALGTYSYQMFLMHRTVQCDAQTSALKFHFLYLRTKHHCRSCGQVFCNSCASYRCRVAGYSTLVRVIYVTFGLLRYFFPRCANPVLWNYKCDFYLLQGKRNQKPLVQKLKPKNNIFLS